MAKSPRAEQLTKLRDLVVLAERKNITSQRDLVSFAFEENIFVKDNGTRWKHSRIFQYTDGLQWFGLNKAEKGSGKIILSEEARRIAAVGQKNYRTKRLKDEEKELFADIIFSIDYVQNNFVKYFSLDQRPIRDTSKFAKNALPVYVKKIYQKKTLDQRTGEAKTRRLCDIVTEPGTEYQQIESTEFLYTMRYWFLRDLGIIDEIHISPEYNIRHNYMVFPIKSRIYDFSNVKKLESMLREICSKYERVVPVPVLIYRICKQFYVPVNDAKRLIETLFHEKPNIYYLNRAPEILLDMKYEQSYIAVDGFWRDELHIMSK